MAGSLFLRAYVIRTSQRTYLVRAGVLDCGYSRNSIFFFQQQWLFRLKFKLNEIVAHKAIWVVCWLVGRLRLDWSWASSYAILRRPHL